MLSFHIKEIFFKTGSLSKYLQRLVGSDTIMSDILPYSTTYNTYLML